MNNMPSKKSIISLVLGSALAATLVAGSAASAADNPFTAQSHQKGFMVAGSHNGDKSENGSSKDAHGDKKHRGAPCGMFIMADTDKDGRVSKEEHARHAEMMFDQVDINKDGYIDQNEASEMMKKCPGHGQGHSQG